jgi:radical SAM protein with 4Fe4S-binding SPASM domain
MNENPYSNTKLSAYPDVVDKLREGTWEGMLTVHLMPQNLCNQSCEFCSYRMDGNKNSQHIDYSKSLPQESLAQIFEDMARLGVKGVEVTGGGEPLAYPFIEKIFDLAITHDIRTALVTNGTLLQKHDVARIAYDLSWARVSIDAAKAETYSSMRKCPESHFERAWTSVDLLRENATRADFKLGVSFVLSNTNVGEVYAFVERAARSSADNVRLSSTFSDKHGSYFSDHDAMEEAIEQSIEAVKDFESDDFRIHNLLPTRAHENEHPHQDYDECYTKDLLCVVEGAGKVYTCCTFTGTDKGLLGNVLEHPLGLQGVWKDTLEWRRAMKACEYCDVSCLYRERNLSMIEIVKGSSHLHSEFV